MTLSLSMGGPASAQRSLPVGTAYAGWVAIGAALTVGSAMVTRAKTVSVVTVLLLCGLVGCVVGLKVLH